MLKEFQKKFFVSEISNLKLSLLKTGYFSSVANALTSSLRILHVKKRDFFQDNVISSD